MQYFRVKASNLPAVLAGIPGSHEVEPRGDWHGGCSDPGHCPQHPGVIDGEPAKGVAVPMSGNQFHRKLVELGLVK